MKTGKSVLVYSIPIERQLSILKVLNNIKILDKEFCRYKELSVYEREKEIKIDDVFDIGILNLTGIEEEQINNILENDISKMFCLYYSESDNAEVLREKASDKFLESIDDIAVIRDTLVKNIGKSGQKYIVNEESIGKVCLEEVLEKQINKMREV